MHKKSSRGEPENAENVRA